MKRTSGGEVNRREFLKRAGIIGGAALAGCGVNHRIAVTPQSEPVRTGGVAIVIDPSDPVASVAPSKWAIDQLGQTLRHRGIFVRQCAHLDQAANADVCIFAGGGDFAEWNELLKSSGAVLAEKPESLALGRIKRENQTVVLAGGRNSRGLIYALCELAERVQSSANPLDTLRTLPSVSEQSHNKVRGVMRMFVSDVEDKSWFHDQSFWQKYLTMLISQRFNRFNLALGLGYDNFRNLTDTYFFFAYPFLLKVPGYDVRAVGLSDDERDRNLQSLRYISDQAAARGLHFQLGLWTHAFQWADSPHANYVIDGLTPDKHAAYCRDALQHLLQSCPNIHGVTFRVHGESGVPERSYDFWKTVFDGVARSGRKMEIDLHAKGMDQKMIDTALGTGLPVNISPKFWAEHMGLPYIPASIREEEMPHKASSGQFALSSGERSFLRYGYGDLMREDRKYSVVTRIWPGTQRLLLWGDAKYAAEYGRIFNFCGMDGVELMEPLSFKGRQGSGLPGGRGGYVDEKLKPAGGDWEKYLITYRMWGRMSFNPDADLRPRDAHESALGTASRILPLITTAHDPSAANFNYWPEMYTNMSIVDPAHPGSYSDTPSPKDFGHVSSLDPQLFSTIHEYAGSLLAGQAIGKVSPLEVAEQLLQWSDGIEADLNSINSDAERSPSPEHLRMDIDTQIVCNMGRFFAWKIRAAVFWEIFRQTSHQLAMTSALDNYHRAKNAWLSASEYAGVIYRDDLTFGPVAHLRGHWSLRMPAIEADIAAMEKQMPTDGPPAQYDPEVVNGIVTRIFTEPVSKPDIKVEHTPAASFRRGSEVAIQMRCGPEVASARLWYRRVNQAERWAATDMRKAGNIYSAAIPGDYTKSPYPLQYYFELRGDDFARPYPGFGPDFTGQPYYLVRGG